jgi:hypothetical protein
MDNNVTCAYPLQGTNNASIKKIRMGEYHLAWQKAINILKQDGHLFFGGQEIQEGIRDEDIKVAYQKLMSPSNNLFEMSLFFITKKIRAIKDMVREDITLFQEIW